MLDAVPPKARTLEPVWVDLLRRIASGDARALEALYARTGRIVFTLILRITNDRETADEVTLDVFHDVWRRAGDYDAAGGTVIGWILNQARCRAIDRLRFESRRKRAGPLPAASAEVEPGPEQHLDALEREQRLRAALTTLNETERQAIETAYFLGLSYSEAAQHLQQPIGTVKTRIRAGLEKLRRALAGEGPTP